MRIACECGAKLNVPDAAAGKRARCPSCGAVLRIPVPEPAFEVVEDEPPKRVVAEVDDPPRPRKRRLKKGRSEHDNDPEGSPFWKTRAGMILNGLGLIGLGVGGIAFYLFSNANDKNGLLIAGILCIGFGIGGVVTGVTRGE